MIPCVKDPGNDSLQTLYRDLLNSLNCP